MPEVTISKKSNLWQSILASASSHAPPPHPVNIIVVGDHHHIRKNLFVDVALPSSSVSDSVTTIAHADTLLDYTTTELSYPDSDVSVPVHVWHVYDPAQLAALPTLISRVELHSSSSPSTSLLSSFARRSSVASTAHSAQHASSSSSAATPLTLEQSGLADTMVVVCLDADAADTLALRMHMWGLALARVLQPHAARVRAPDAAGVDTGKQSNSETSKSTFPEHRDTAPLDVCRLVQCALGATDLPARPAHTPATLTPSPLPLPMLFLLPSSPALGACLSALPAGGFDHYAHLLRTARTAALHWGAALLLTSHADHHTALSLAARDDAGARTGGPLPALSSLSLLAQYALHTVAAVRHTARAHEAVGTGTGTSVHRRESPSPAPVFPYAAVPVGSPLMPLAFMPVGADTVSALDTLAPHTTLQPSGGAGAGADAPELEDAYALSALLSPSMPLPPAFTQANVHAALALPQPSLATLFPPSPARRRVHMHSLIRARLAVALSAPQLDARVGQLLHAAAQQPASVSTPLVSAHPREALTGSGTSGAGLSMALSSGGGPSLSALALSAPPSPAVSAHALTHGHGAGMGFSASAGTGTVLPPLPEVSVARPSAADTVGPLSSLASPSPAAAPAPATPMAGRPPAGAGMGAPSSVSSMRKSIGGASAKDFFLNLLNKPGKDTKDRGAGAGGTVPSLLSPKSEDK